MSKVGSGRGWFGSRGQQRERWERRRAGLSSRFVGRMARGSTPPPVEAADELAARRRFEALVAPHAAAVRRRAAELCRSRFDAEDLAQDALLRAYRATGQVTDPGRVRGWLVRIVTNTFIDLLRKHRRQPAHVELAADLPAPEPPVERAWEAIGTDDVRAAVELLPDDVRDTYRLFALEGLDYAEIARRQGIAPATVGSRVFRARKRLRALLVTPAPEP